MPFRTYRYSSSLGFVTPFLKFCLLFSHIFLCLFFRQAPFTFSHHNQNMCPFCLSTSSRNRPISLLSTYSPFTPLHYNHTFFSLAFFFKPTSLGNSSIFSSFCTGQKIVDFPRYNTKCSGENKILRGIFRILYLVFLDSI